LIYCCIFAATTSVTPRLQRASSFRAAQRERSGTTTDLEIQQVEPGVYIGEYLPLVAGRYSLDITLENIPIKGFI
jgi:hypothetical protein